MSSYADFMTAHKSAQGGSYTHTRIGDKSLGVFGGVYNIPDEHYPEFWQLYSKHLQSGKQEYLTEKQYADGSLVVDLDFHYAPDDGRVLTRQVELGTGEGNCNSPFLHFGFGPATGPLHVEVRWPDGTRTELAEVAPDSAIDLAYGGEPTIRPLRALAGVDLSE